MAQSGAHLEQWHTARRFPRVPITTSVEIHARRTQGAPIIGNIENVSVGGLLASCREHFDHQTEVAMLFSLPNGHAIRAFGRVTYAVPGKRYGIEFTDLDRDGRVELERFTQKMMGYNRRSGRVPYRVRLTVRPSDRPGEEEPAMTVLASRNGGLLVCRTPYTKGQEIYVGWPERETGAQARVVFQQVWEADQMVELGFEFLDQENFWELDFPEEGA
ncbi:MAG: PilZ domain-containing protein [Acidobacteriia bacterium]|nr:PilZ domain-containing protein [Terriglobia bacterium]